jgi:hypothetical protein
MKFINNMVIIIFFNLLFTFLSCKNQIQNNYVKRENNFLYKSDSAWITIKEDSIYHFYWGIKPIDKSDFSGHFQIAWNDSNIFFRIHILDDVKYTHPIPTDSLERTLWDPNDYDQISLLFDVNNNEKYDVKYSFNYSLDSVFGSFKTKKGVEFIQKDTKGGYIMKIKIPLCNIKKVEQGSLRFQIIVNDHDRRYDQQGKDILGRWESQIGEGRLIILK